MIISGFGMCNGYYQKMKTGKCNLNQFYARRYKKTVPFFALLIVLNCVIDCNLETFYEGFIELTMLFGFLPNNTLNVIGVAWTLGVIFVFYIIFPFIVVLLDNKRRGWMAFTVSLAITFMCQVYFMTDKFVTPNFIMRHSFLYCLPYFLCGGLIYLYRNELSAVVNSHKQIVLVGCVILVAGYLLTPDIICQFDIIVPKTLLLYSAIICAVLGEKNKWLGNKFTSFISEISMEMYLAHMVVFRIVEKLNIQMLFGDAFLGYIVTYAMVVIILIAAISLYRKGEKIIIQKIE